ncbi:MAG: Gfo/Idh/MocA family oxidoreductase [Chloroflexi bacterium]|nr:Gfo/Idh/MocA family oxidoreductase [Chloroflexota bacterium]
MNERIRIGVIGMGPMGQKHARSVAENPDAQLAAVVTRRAQVGSEMSARYGCRAYDDYRALLAALDIDAVVIASATREHPEHIIAAAHARKDIFTEKPTALTLDDADRVIAAVTQNNVRCMVGFMRRFDPAYAAAKQKIDAGEIGKPVTFKAVSRDPIWPAHEDDDPRTSGGFWVDMGVHDFDLARWLMGQEVRAVYAVGGAFVYPALEQFQDMDNGIVSFTYAQDAIGSAELSRNARYGYDIRTEVLGSEGSVWIGSIQQTALQVLTKAGVTHDVNPWYLERFDRAFRNEINAFIAALRAGERELTPSVYDARAALAIGIAARDSWRSGKVVEVVR